MSEDINNAALPVALDTLIAANEYPQTLQSFFDRAEELFADITDTAEHIEGEDSLAISDIVFKSSAQLLENADVFNYSEIELAKDEDAVDSDTDTGLDSANDENEDDSDDDIVNDGVGELDTLEDGKESLVVITENLLEILGSAHVKVSCWFIKASASANYFRNGVSIKQADSNYVLRSVGQWLFSVDELIDDIREPYAAYLNSLNCFATEAHNKAVSICNESWSNFVASVEADDEIEEDEIEENYDPAFR